MKRTWALNTRNIGALAKVLPKLGKMEASISVRVSVAELQKLTPEQCKAFLDGIAAVVSAETTIEDDGKD